MSFKKRILQNLFIAAAEYNKLLSATILVRSQKFKYYKQYFLHFYEDNFLHLTGVQTSLKPKDFFQCCLNKTLLLNQFDCDSSPELKGKSREKTKHLLNIRYLFQSILYFQENFRSNKIFCDIVVTNGSFTLGFVAIKNGNCVPRSLLNKNKVDMRLAIDNSSFEIIESK